MMVDARIKAKAQNKQTNLARLVVSTHPSGAKKKRLPPPSSTPPTAAPPETGEVKKTKPQTPGVSLEESTGSNLKLPSGL